MSNQRQPGRVQTIGNPPAVNVRATRGVKKSLLILVFAIAGGGAILWAQSPALPASAVAAAAPETEASSVRLLVGRSAVLDVGSNIARVSLTSADVADALVTSPQQLLINGKTPGTISMFIWDRQGSFTRYEVVVQRDLARLTEQMGELFPDQHIGVQSNGKNVVLTGTVTSKDVIEKAVNVAAGYVEKRDEVVTLLQLQAGAPSNQVLLRVRFAEVGRSAMSELGASFAANGFKDGRWYGRTTTQQFAAPEWDEDGKFVFSDFLNLFLFDAKQELAGVIKALQTKGLFQSLAEPNLVSESGKEASFLAGGEFPIPVVQGSGGNLGVTVVFKEFGIRLTFTPTVNGNRVHLKVRPEVSTLDFNNAVILNGFRIPALTTRRTETELELDNGQTFAIAGLMNNSLNSTMQRIPGIGDIPILGLLFRSKQAQKNQTELVVMITPEILPNGSSGVTPDVPGMTEPFMPPFPQNQLVTPPPPAFGAVRPARNAQVAGTPAPKPASVQTAQVAAQTPRAADASAVGARPVAAPAATAGRSAVTRTLTPKEQEAMAKALREEQKQAREEQEKAAAAQKKSDEEARNRQQAEERAQAAETRRMAEQTLAANREAEKERQRLEKLAREQAKRDAEAAKRAEKDEAARLKAAEAASQKGSNP